MLNHAVCILLDYSICLSNNADMQEEDDGDAEDVDEPVDEYLCAKMHLVGSCLEPGSARLSDCKQVRPCLYLKDPCWTRAQTLQKLSPVKVQGWLRIARLKSQRLKGFVHKALTGTSNEGGPGW